jgi:GNAT superfamily N-acetyltransferase
VARELEIRAGGPSDEDGLLGLFDEAVRWLVARGQARQWGSEPFSGRPDMRARVQSMTLGGGLWIAEQDGQMVGALVVGPAPAYAAPATVAELYIVLLLTSRSHAGRGIGGRLIAKAEELARSGRRQLLRVDCWADAPSLVAWYERQGFARSGTFDQDGWRGQFLSRAVRAVPIDQPPP